jgi:aspartate aminotransferase
MVLNKAMTEYDSTPIDEDFLKKYCSKMLEALDKLENWLEKL